VARADGEPPYRQLPGIQHFITNAVFDQIESGVTIPVAADQGA